jgi:hypothetical protein
VKFVDLSGLTTLVELLEETSTALQVEGLLSDNRWQAFILHESQWYTLFVHTTELVGEIEAELVSGDPFKAKRDFSQFMRETRKLCEQLSRLLALSS